MTEPSAGLEPGARIAGYTIERPIGRGGMGAVYVATHDRLKRHVALKVLAPELAQDAGFRERFIRESELAASLEHPSVVPIFDADEQDGILFIAMRYVEGGDLGAHLRDNGPLSVGATAALIEQIAGALDAAHAAGLVHRDVKPQNILVDASSRAYLTDFGVAKRTASAGLTRAGTFLGSVEYAAPEQLEGKAIDGRADVYSLGCVTYQCLSGETPFPRDSEVAIILAHIKDPPPSFAPLHPELASLDEVIATALAKDPADRYPRSGELAAKLKAAATTPGNETTTVPSPLPPAKPARRTVIEIPPISAPPPPPVPPADDRLGGAVRTLATQAGLRVGALVGLITVVVPALIVFALSLSGIASLQLALGTRYQPQESPSVGAQIARSVFAPWLVQYTGHDGDTASAGRYLVLPAFVILALVFVLSALWLRRRIPSGSTRLIALATTALVAAAVVSLLAATLSYHTGSAPNTTDFSFSPSHYAPAVIVETILVGLLTFGVVGTWREPARSAAKLAAAVGLTVFLAAAIAFPLGTVAGGARNTDGQAKLLRDVGVTIPWAGGVAGAALPLALQAKASLHTGGGLNSPFAHPISGHANLYIYRPKLAEYMDTHASARLESYAGTGGVLWRIAGLLASVAVAGAWVLAAVLLVRRLGAPKAVVGLRHGLALGGAGAILMGALAWLSVARYSFTSSGIVTSYGFAIHKAAGLQTAGVLIVLCGATGLIYAALRPSAYRYAPWHPSRTPRAKAVSPKPAAPKPAAPKAAAPDCTRCGTPFGTAGEQFCANCGAPRP